MPSSRNYRVHMVSLENMDEGGFAVIMGINNLTEAHVIALEIYMKKVRAVVEAWKIEGIENKMRDKKTLDDHPGNEFA